MDGIAQGETKTFIQVTETWVPEGDKLVFAGGDYGGLDAFEAGSRQVSFDKGEGLPGKAWAEEKPVVLKAFDGSYFKRTELAKESGLTAAIAIPIFEGNELKAVMVVLCGDDDERIGAIEVWAADDDGLLSLDDGYYGAASEFEFVSKKTHFPKGQGLPGGVWAADTPILMRELGTGYRFIRATEAGKAGLTTGLGLPIPLPGVLPRANVVTLLSALGTPIARRFEIWDIRCDQTGTPKAGVLIDGICEKQGALWQDDGSGTSGDRPTIYPWKGPLGKVLGTGLPLAERGGAGLPAGYKSFVGFPIYSGGDLSHVIAWYN